MIAPEPVRFVCSQCQLVGYSVVCAECGRAFTAHRPDARYCSTRCRVAAHRERSSS